MSFLHSGYDCYGIGVPEIVAQKFPGTILFHAAKSYDFPFHSIRFTFENKMLPVIAIPLL